MHACADLGNFLQIDALEGDIVLLILLLGNEDAFGGIDALVDLEPQEVLDFEGLGYGGGVPCRLR